MVRWKRVRKQHQSFSIGSRESLSFNVWVFDAAQQDGGVIEMPIRVAGIGLEGGGFEDQRAELVGNADSGRLTRDDLQAGVDGSAKGLGSAVNLHHCASS